MKLLYIIKRERTDTLNKMIESHNKLADVSVIDMRENKNYAEIIDTVFENDKVITW